MWHEFGRLTMPKRFFDFVVALALIVLLAPVMLAVAVSVVWFLGFPILFRQLRPGFLGVPFLVLKFRTMQQSLGPDGLLLPDAERLGSFGRFLRRFSLDELPQLFNVLAGHMSLVGPRPLLMEYLPLYTADQSRRHRVRPGITGWAQINGRNAISWEDKFALDVWYVDHRTFWLDIQILLATAGKVFAGSGVSKTGSVTTEKFMGTSHMENGR
jgi:sugar transferase EpsL